MTHKNRFIGDAHAVVAMIFRPRAGYGPISSSPPPFVSKNNDASFPLPIPIVPTENCNVDEFGNVQRETWFAPPVPLSECELFFILRATNPKDRWSGQVAFPGGRKKNLQETDRDCAVRETMEEVGMDISQFKLLGRTHDRVLLQRNKKLVVSCLMFFADENANCGVLEESEVAACGWCPVKHFALPKVEICQPVKIPVKSETAAVVTLLNLFGVNNLVFARYRLPIAGSGNFEFNLWGLTLGLVSEAIMDIGLVNEPLNQLPQSKHRLPFTPAEQIFDSQVHNLLYSVWKQMMPPMDFMRGIQTYALALGVFAPAMVATASAATFYKLSKL